MQEFFEQRTLEQVLSDLRARYQRRPGRAPAEMIRKVQAEIAGRDATQQSHEAVEPGQRSSTRTLPAA
jgi:hypothetical protein